MNKMKKGKTDSRDKIQQIAIHQQCIDIAAGVNLVESEGTYSSAYIELEVKEPWKYIGQIRNPIIRNYRWFAKDYIYKPFTVSLGILERDKYDAFEKIENCYRLYK